MNTIEAPKQSDSDPLIPQEILDKKSDRLLTIKDIARIAGVSPSAISRFTHESGYVSDEKRQRIQETIDSTGWKPDADAQQVSHARQSKGQPTLADVAELAGVSIATASRILSQEQHLVPHRGRENQINVLEASLVLGWSPDEHARSLQQRRTSHLDIDKSREPKTPTDVRLTQRIAQIADVSEKTVYRWFDNKVTRPETCKRIEEAVKLLNEQFNQLSPHHENPLSEDQENEFE